MNTNPRFRVRDLVQGGTTTCLLQSQGIVRAIDISEGPGGGWVYSVEPSGGGDWLKGLDERELAPVETTATRAKAKQARLEHHATQARHWADAADREEVDATDERENTLSQTVKRERGQRFAAISQAHGLAAVASTLAESAVAIEQ